MAYNYLDELLKRSGGYFGQEGVTEFDPMATDSRLGNAPQVEKERNQLAAIIQGKVLSGDLDGASQLAVTPEHRTLIDVAYRQRMNQQGGQRSDLLGDYQRMQDTSVAKSRMEQDRMMKMAQMGAQIRASDANANRDNKAASLMGLPKPGMKTPETAAQSAFGVELAKMDAKELDDLRNASLKAQGGVNRVKQMRELAESGVYSGSFAEGRVGVANFFDSIGIPLDPKKLANSQEYLKHAKELTLSLLKEGVGTNQISNADLAFVNQTVPQLETNPEARKNLLNFIEKKLQTSVDRFGKADEYARANNGLRGFKYQEEAPPDAPAGAVAPDAAVQYLKANPAMRTAFDMKYGQGAAAKALGQ